MKIYLMGDQNIVEKITRDVKDLDNIMENVRVNDLVKYFEKNNLEYIIKIRGENMIEDLDGTIGFFSDLIASHNFSINDFISSIGIDAPIIKAPNRGLKMETALIQIRAEDENSLIMKYFEENANKFDLLVFDENEKELGSIFLGFDIKKKHSPCIFKR